MKLLPPRHWSFVNVQEGFSCTSASDTACALQIQALSFTLDDEEDEDKTCSTSDSDAEESELPVKKIRKNPDVDTSFLPDREREDEENRLREELRQVCDTLSYV
jgi:hypothetical protein